MPEHLAPIGTALIGYRAGDVIEWKVPAGLRKLKVLEVLYQPEAAGDYHL
jgi:regulator of nucleoside diphosphate kinase